MKLGIENKARLAFAAVLLLAAVAGAGWYLLAASRYTTYQIVTRDPVSGLIADAPVEFHGVDVGKVKSVELIDSQSVRILLSVDDGAPVTKATVATITTRGLAARGFTGYVYVSLDDALTDSGRLAAPPGERYPAIPLAPPQSVSLDVAISKMNDNVEFISERVRKVLDDRTVASLKQSVDQLQRVTKTLADDNDKLNALIVNGERASEQLQPLLETSKDTLKELNTQILPQAHKTLTSLDNLSTGLTGFATKVNRDPSIIVRGAAPPPLGPGELP
jgi:phospholipid/cholesterol/gamma-HCH transport system substrate-binding protein